MKRATIPTDMREREALVFRYMARYGQRPETEARYRDAIVAFQSIDHLTLTVSDIARLYGLEPECLRNQLKRHFPESIAARETLRAQLGYRETANHGLKPVTVNRYAAAVEMLRDTSLTVREVARRCGVSYQGLQQHLLFHHKDIAESRMLSRTDALLKPLQDRTVSPTGGARLPRPGTVALYAPALELYRSTDLPMTEIARRCGIAVHSFAGYLQRWHQEDMEKRRKERETIQSSKREMDKHRADRSRSRAASLKYMPALERIVSGETLSQAARATGVQLCNLSVWLKKHYPEVLEKARAGMMTLPSGKIVLRRTHDRYDPISQYIATHPSKPTKEVARKFEVPVSSLTKHMASDYPEIWARHCKVCALKAKKA